MLDDILKKIMEKQRSGNNDLIQLFTNFESLPNNTAVSLAKCMESYAGTLGYPDVLNVFKWGSVGYGEQRLLQTARTLNNYRHLGPLEVANLIRARKSSMELVDNINTILNDKMILNRIQKYSTHENINMIVAVYTIQLMNNMDKANILSHTKIFDKPYIRKAIYSVSQKASYAIIDLISDGKEDAVNDLIKVYNKYPQYQEEIASLCLEKDNHLFLKELLLDIAYESIKKDKRYLRKISKTLFAKYRFMVKDRKFGRKIPYEDLDLIAKSYELVQSVHKARNSKDKGRIIEGYEAELNRSINQAEDFDKKLKNIRTYCNEVYKRMREHAGELMVVTNA